MSITTKNGSKHNSEAKKAAFAPSLERRFPPLRVADAGTVRLGAQGPAFRRIADAGAVRLGAQGPCFRAVIADAGRVRLGAQGPLFR